MDVELAVRDNASSSRRAFSASRPVLYIAIILGVVLAAYAYKLRTDGIFACQADGYTPDRYLAYCGATGYGNYEHGAFWFGLEPSVLDAAAHADAMFLGDSRMQFAFSTDSTVRWFSAAPARYYLLGFTYGENVSFTGKLLSRVNPRAKMYVIAVEFFERSESIPAKDVMRNQDAHYRYAVKRLWQSVHRPICGILSVICGDRLAIYRSRQTGSYSLNLERWVGGAANSHVFFDRDIDEERVKNYVASAREFLSRVPAGSECIILTTIPTIREKAYAYSPSVNTATAVAKALGLSFVAPHLDGLRTYDGSHLDRPSAERWSDAFLREAGPQIQKCINKPPS